MALQTFNWANLPVQESPLTNLWENAFKGYQMGRAPAKMDEEQSQRQQALALQKLELEHKPKEFELSDQQKTLANAIQSEALKNLPEKTRLEMARIQSQINKNNRAETGLGNAPKASGDIANELVIQGLEERFGKDDPRILNLRNIQKAKEEANKAKASNQEKYANSLSFRLLPPDEKKRAVAMTSGMGMDPTEGEAALVSGKTLSEIAKEKGIKLDKVIPIYPAAGENIKQMQRRAAFVNELSNLEEKTTEGMAKYQNKFYGYSLDQIADSIKNDDPDTQGKVLASRALQPEIAALRLKVAGGNIGIEAIREMTEKSLGELKVLESTISPEAYKAMQKYMNKWLMDASKEADRTITEYSMLKTNEQKSAESESGMGNDPLGLF